MEALKFFRNVVVVIVAFFLIMMVYSRVSKDATPETPQPETPAPVEPSPFKLISEKGIEIFIDEPKTGVPIGNPLHISGKAPGNWFFEASAPVTLTNWDGLIIGEGYIQATGEWMTTDYVPFIGEITYTKPDYGANGYLILKKDNASGEPIHDDSAQMTLTF
jgi:hypothetical protein